MRFRQATITYLAPRLAVVIGCAAFTLDTVLINSRHWYQYLSYIKSTKKPTDEIIHFDNWMPHSSEVFTVVVTAGVWVQQGRGPASPARLRLCSRVTELVLAGLLQHCLPPSVSTRRRRRRVVLRPRGYIYVTTTVHQHNRNLCSRYFFSS